MVLVTAQSSVIRYSAAWAFWQHVKHLPWRKKSHIDVEKMFSVVRSGVAASPLLNRFGAGILEANSKGSRAARKRDVFRKDLGLIVEAARDTGASLPGSTLVQQLYNTTGTEEIQERGVVGLMLALEKWQQSLS